MSYDPSHHRRLPPQERWPAATPARGWPAADAFAADAFAAGPREAGQSRGAGQEDWTAAAAAAAGRGRHAGRGAGGTGGYREPGHAGSDYPGRDYPDWEYTGREYTGREYTGAGFVPGERPGHVEQGYRDPGYVAEAPGYVTPDYPGPGYVPQASGYVPQDYRSPDDGTYLYADRSNLAPDYAGRDYATSDYAGRDYAERDYTTPGYVERGYVASEYAAPDYGGRDVAGAYPQRPFGGNANVAGPDGWDGFMYRDREDPVPARPREWPGAGAPDADLVPGGWQADQELRRAAARRGRLVAAVSGLLAVAVLAGVATLVSGFVGPQASPAGVLTGLVATWRPGLVAHFGGDAPRLALAAVAAGLALWIGLLSRRATALGVAGLAVFGLLGAYAVVTRPQAQVSDVLPTVAGGVAAIAALVWLVYASAPVSPALARGGRRRSR